MHETLIQFQNLTHLSANLSAKIRLISGLSIKVRGRPPLNVILSVQAWQRICEASRKEFELIYQRLGVTIQERGESFYNPFLAPLVEELMASGVAVESEGAKVSLLLYLYP